MVLKNLSFKGFLALIRLGRKSSGATKHMVISSFRKAGAFTNKVRGIRGSARRWVNEKERFDWTCARVNAALVAAGLHQWKDPRGVKLGGKLSDDRNICEAFYAYADEVLEGVKKHTCDKKIYWRPGSIRINNEKTLCVQVWVWDQCFCYVPRKNNPVIRQ